MTASLYQSGSASNGSGAATGAASTRSIMTTSLQRERLPRQAAGAVERRLWPEFPQLLLRSAFLGSGRGRDTRFRRAELGAAEKDEASSRALLLRAATGGLDGRTTQGRALFRCHPLKWRRVHPSSASP